MNFFECQIFQATGDKSPARKLAFCSLSPRSPTLQLFGTSTCKETSKDLIQGTQDSKDFGRVCREWTNGFMTVCGHTCPKSNSKSSGPKTISASQMVSDGQLFRYRITEELLTNNEYSELMSSLLTAASAYASWRRFEQ
jgi:hypothetical protein